MKQLRKDDRYLKKRLSKAIRKGAVDTMKLTLDQLRDELKKAEEQTRSIRLSKKELEKQINQYDQ